MANEEKYQMHKEKLNKGLHRFLTGFVIGAVLGIFYASIESGGPFESVMYILLTGYLLGSAVGAWNMIPLIPLTLIAIVGKLFLSIFLGMFLVPILLIYHFAMMCMYKRQIPDNTSI